MDVRIARVIETLSCLAELPLKPHDGSLAHELAGLGSLLLSSRRATGGRVYYLRLGLDNQLEGSDEPDPQVQLISAKDPGKTYGKPAFVRRTGQGRGLHCSIYVGPTPEEDVVFQLVVPQA